MLLAQMMEQMNSLEQRALVCVESSVDAASLEAVRLQFLGKKGELTHLLKGLGQLKPDERPQVGEKVNSLKNILEEAIKKKSDFFDNQAIISQLQGETIDVTLPASSPPLGAWHPLSLVEIKIRRYFEAMGFDVVRGPDIETDWYNFEALNIPKDHPARAMQDTFYLTSDTLLRTHTSGVQIRWMQKNSPPIAMIAPGTVYRRDAVDATHSPQFRQVEGLFVDKSVSMADLKGVLLDFFKSLFGAQTKLRLRPSYFPFTEPSAEVDIWFRDQWLEVAGCGLVHPQVLKNGGIDPGKYSGFAFGMGIERLAMILFGVDDIRSFSQNDPKFLRSFV